MARHDLGPRRTESVESYLRETRVVAAVALLALTGGVLSDVFESHFWVNHPLLAGLAASVIVVMLSVALVNEAVERRRRRRWRVLAQYVMLGLVRNARLVWTGVMELVGALPSDGYTVAEMDAAARIARDTPRLTKAVRELAGDGDQRRLLQNEIAHLAGQSDEVLGRWAAVMLDVDAYAELIDRHVELASDLAWLGSLLDYSDPPEDDKRRRRASHSSPAVQIEGEIDDDQLADRIVAITQLAERLDRGTLDFAMRLVPLDWWAARLGTTAPTIALSSTDEPEARPAERPVP